MCCGRMGLGDFSLGGPACERESGAELNIELKAWNLSSLCWLLGSDPSCLPRGCNKMECMRITQRVIELSN